MSLNHYVIPKYPLDISQLNYSILKDNSVECSERGNGTFYYWIKNKSTRGIDITIYDNRIEVRNTSLSNKYDYELTNRIVESLLSLTKGIIIDEEETEVQSILLFDSKRISELELSDCHLILTLSKEHEDISIHGPIRKVHFGKRLYEELKQFSEDQLRDNVFNIILKVNYDIPNFEYGTVLQVGNTEKDKKIMKVVSNQVDCIIDKYDYIIISDEGNKSITITNQTLNSLLPTDWTLVDEFTIVAPIIGDKQWKEFVERARIYNLE